MHRTLCTVCLATFTSLLSTPSFASGCDGSKVPGFQTFTDANCHTLDHPIPVGPTKQELEAEKHIGTTTAGPLKVAPPPKPVNYGPIRHTGAPPPAPPIKHTGRP